MFFRIIVKYYSSIEYLRFHSEIVLYFDASHSAIFIKFIIYWKSSESLFTFITILLGLHNCKKRKESCIQRRISSLNSYTLEDKFYFVWFEEYCQMVDTLREDFILEMEEGPSLWFYWWRIMDKKNIYDNLMLFS